MQHTRLNSFAVSDARIVTKRDAWNLYRSVILVALAMCCAVVGTATAQQDTATNTSSLALDQAAALRVSQAAVGRVIGDYTLLDITGRPVRLSSYRGKPLLVNFIYTGCFKICPTTTQVLQKIISIAQDALGDGHFNVISIGFNQPADSPQALKSFAAQYGIKSPDWKFLSPPAAIVPDLTRDFGFTYATTAAGFDHLLQVSLVDAEGRIYRQIYGEDYSANYLIDPLKQLITGNPVAETTSISAILNRVKILCSVYDPDTGTYRVSYAIAFEIAGFATFVLWAIWFFFKEWLARRHLARRSRA